MSYRSRPLLVLLLSVCLGIYQYLEKVVVTLQHLGLMAEEERAFPPSYVNLDDSLHDRAMVRARIGTADTTAVILNWSRLDNVVLIVSILCGSSLESTIHTVLVWNNNPKALFVNDFHECTGDRLRIYNSPQNLYFQARFMACAMANTPYCFIQDDDYLVLPEVVMAMRLQIAPSGPKSAIYVLPPHEMLSTQLRNIRIGSHVHTSFAWLGHGALISRHLAVDFLDLMDTLRMTEDERKMADNYFSILRNVAPEVWFDQGIALYGGNAFTEGAAGVERNRRHIVRAMEILESSIHHNGEVGSAPKQLQFVNADEVSEVHTANESQWRTPCRGIVCILESNIAVLPPELIDAGAESTRPMLSQEEERLQMLSRDNRATYLHHPPSNAVDGLSSTFFRSLQNGRQGDSIVLNTLDNPIMFSGLTELVFLVNAATADALRSCNVGVTFSGGPDIDEAIDPPRCVSLAPSIDLNWRRLRECSVPLVSMILNEDVKIQRPIRAVRITLERDVNTKWEIYEIWLRGIPAATLM